MDRVKRSTHIRFDRVKRHRLASKVLHESANPVKSSRYSLQRTKSTGLLLEPNSKPRELLHPVVCMPFGKPDAGAWHPPEPSGSRAKVGYGARRGIPSQQFLLGDRYKLFYLMRACLWLDGDVAFRKGHRALQTLIEKLHFDGRNTNPKSIFPGQAMHSGQLVAPTHSECATLHHILPHQ